jgi:phage terminase small subunit
MTEKQKKFCSEYLKSLNATKAAIKAGYSKDTAYSIGHENLSKPEIKEYVKKRIDKSLEADNISLRKRILDELSKIAYDPMSDDDSKVRTNDKLKALELLGKYDCMFTDKVEHTTIDSEGNKAGFVFVDPPKKNADTK